MKPKRIKTKICPYCGHAVEGGKVVMMGDYWAHAECKRKAVEKKRMERAIRRTREEVEQFQRDMERRKEGRVNDCRTTP